MNIMKIKLLGIIGLVALLNFTASAQIFVKGTKLASLGVGLGSPYGLGFVTPSIQANIDIGITDKLGIGRIGVGGILAYSGGRQSYNYFYGAYDVTYSNFTIGARATYHFDLDIDKVDLYGGVILGYNISSSSNNYANTNNGYFIKPKSYSLPVAGAFAGARYMFNENFGAYAELGNAISFTTVGLTLKF